MQLEVCGAKVDITVSGSGERAALLLHGWACSAHLMRNVAAALEGGMRVAAVDFPDSISRGCHPVDIHRAGDAGQRCQFLKKAAFVPYRTLYALDFPNLLVAGRCFSADEVASASVRVQASVMGLGQAAGVGAGMCVKQGCSVDKVDVKILRAKLVDMGAVLD